MKSLVTARAVAVVDEPTAYSNELPDGLLLRLPPEVDGAAKALVQAVLQRWEPDSDLRQSWVARFRRENRRLLDRLMDECHVRDEQSQRNVA